MLVTSPIMRGNRYYYLLPYKSRLCSGYRTGLCTVGTRKLFDIGKDDTIQLTLSSRRIAEAHKVQLKWDPCTEAFRWRLWNVGKFKAMLEPMSNVLIDEDVQAGSYYLQCSIIEEGYA